jgi:excisionase family DNA binding protein
VIAHRRAKADCDGWGHRPCEPWARQCGLTVSPPLQTRFGPGCCDHSRPGGRARICIDAETVRCAATGPSHMPMQNRSLPILLNADETAELLRTTRAAIYVMVSRGQIPGVTRIGRRVLFRSDELLHWVDQKRAPSPRE